MNNQFNYFKSDPAEDTNKVKSNVSTNTNELYHDPSVWYMKGVYNGSIEMVSYLIETIKSSSLTSKTSYTNQFFSNETQFLIGSLSEFHSVYLNSFKNSDLDAEFIAEPCESTKFPLNNKKLIKHIRNRLPYRNRNVCIKRNRSNESTSDTSEDENITDYKNVINENIDHKLGWNKTLNFPSFFQPNNGLKDKPDNNKDTTLDENNTVPIFLLHASQDYYLSATIDKSLIEDCFWENILKKDNLNASTKHTVKIDVVHPSNYVIKPRFSNVSSKKLTNSNSELINYNNSQNKNYPDSFNQIPDGSYEKNLQKFNQQCEFKSHFPCNSSRPLLTAPVLNQQITPRRPFAYNPNKHQAFSTPIRPNPMELNMYEESHQRHLQNRGIEHLKAKKFYQNNLN